MAPKFGTSGLRGRVTDLTPALVGDHVRAFLSACETGNGLFVGEDLRPSSPRLVQDIVEAASGMGVTVTVCGTVPTPALALAAIDAEAAAIMVTGSHIPADRNGLKFYTPRGEITKADEAAITDAVGTAPGSAASQAGSVRTDDTVGPRFVARILQAFPANTLTGRRIGAFSHSAVGRDLLIEILTGLGAEVIEIGRSKTFIPVDTEAVDPDVRHMIRASTLEHALDALVSTDGDSDRPLLADETGAIIPGDILGQITAEVLGAEAVVTPVSSNSGVMQKGFTQVIRTRIGSPFVIAGMEALKGRVVGYEANGGFLLGFEAQGPTGQIAPLPTRDCILPLVMTLVAAGQGPVSQRVAKEPPVVTLADRLQDVAQEITQPFMARLTRDAASRAPFLAALGATEAGCDLTDGVRMTLTDGCVVHVRPSGNAPELRVYVEAKDRTAAQSLLDRSLRHLSGLLRSE